jgi:hypothetical protein
VTAISNLGEMRAERDVLRAQLDATRAAIGSECVEHVELNDHIDTAEQAHDYLAHEAIDHPSGKLHDFTAALRIVIDQLDRQRRRANWYEAAHDAGKTKLIEHAVEKATADLIADRDRLAARLEQVEPVYEAAKEWRTDSRRGDPLWRGAVDAALGQAVDKAMARSKQP